MSAPNLEINLRLDVVDHDNNAQAIDEREAQALALAMLGDCPNHRADFQLAGVKVPRLVAGLDAESWDSAKLHQLAEQMHQGCIAVFYPDQGAVRWFALMLAPGVTLI